MAYKKWAAKGYFNLALAYFYLFFFPAFLPQHSHGGIAPAIIATADHIMWMVIIKRTANTFVRTTREILNLGIIGTSMATDPILNIKAMAHL